MDSEINSKISDLKNLNHNCYIEFGFFDYVRTLRMNQGADIQTEFRELDQNSEINTVFEI